MLAQVHVEYYISINKVSANGDFSGQLAIRQIDFQAKSSGVLHKRMSSTQTSFPGISNLLFPKGKDLDFPKDNIQSSACLVQLFQFPSDQSQPA